MVATVDQHGRATPASRKKSASATERRRKAAQIERTRREGHAVQARPVKTFQQSAMSKKHR
jgi:hypothetical protein